MRHKTWSQIEGMARRRRFSDATIRIIRALYDLGESVGLACDIEEVVQKPLRIDVVLFINTLRGRPLFWFEIDDTQRGEAQNSLKCIGEPLALTDIPFSSISVVHGTCRRNYCTYLDRIWNEALIPIPRFRIRISIDNTSDQTIAESIRSWWNKLVEAFQFDPEWGSVLDVTRQYQPLFVNLSHELAAAHLAVHSRFAWFLVGQDLLKPERAATLSIARARILQRGGFHAEALREVRLIESLLESNPGVSSQTYDSLQAVKHLLFLCDFQSENSLKHLQSGPAVVQSKYHRSQFLWRSAIIYAINGRFSEADDVLRRYLDDLPDSRIAEGNAALVKFLAALLHGHGDTQHWAQQYSAVQWNAFDADHSSGAADATLHGVTTATCMKVLAADQAGNREAPDLFGDIKAFCKSYDVPSSADGLREIGMVLPKAVKTGTPSARVTTGFFESLTRQRRQDLDVLRAKVNYVCGFN